MKGSTPQPDVKPDAPEGPFLVEGPHTCTRSVNDPNDVHWSVFDRHQGTVAHFANKEHAELFVSLLSPPLAVASEAKTETPRTDAYASCLRGLGTGYYQALDFARTIETNLSSALARCELLEKEKAQTEIQLDEWRCSALLYQSELRDLAAGKKVETQLGFPVEKKIRDLEKERDEARAEREKMRGILASEFISTDSYGVHGSDFYVCSLCGAESGAGVLNKGISHEPDCLLKGCGPIDSSLKKLRDEARNGAASEAENEHLKAQLLRANESVKALEKDKARLLSALQHWQHVWHETDSEHDDCMSASDEAQAAIDSALSQSALGEDGKG